jgi:hypothetical protein
MVANPKPGVAVITAVFGGYDTIPPVPNGFSEAVLVSDVPINSEWSNVVLETRSDSFLSAKLPKFRPDLFCSTASSVWVDANIHDPNDWLFQESAKMLMNHDFALFRHPNRDSVRSEIRESRKFEKYSTSPLEQQYKRYIDTGFQDDVGLWACGLIARHHTIENSEFGDAWFTENARWSIQDQISFSYLIWKKNFKFGVFNGNLWKSPLKFNRHKL